MEKEDMIETKMSFPETWKTIQPKPVSVSAVGTYSIVMRISPVVVLILQIPLGLLWGISMLPVVVALIKILPVRRLPLTLPVLVLIVSSLASQRSKETSPVVRSILIMDSAMTFLRSILPVVPVDVRLQQTRSLRFTFPVET